jgi:hypothetical protein
MIHDVDESLRELVRRRVLDGTKVDVALDAPTREWSAKRSGPTLNFYLYDVTEDLQRRRVQYEEVRDAEGKVVDRRMPPRRFKLSYLVTAWTQRPEDEHRLLSAVLSCFVSSDVLPRDVLQGALADQPEDLRATIALPLPQDRSIADVWTALGGELKPALNLVVTTPFVPLDGRTLEIGPPVLEEPRISVVSGDAVESRTKGKAAGNGAAAAAAPAEPLPEETVDAGTGDKPGRRFAVRAMPPRR